MEAVNGRGRRKQSPMGVESRILLPHGILSLDKCIIITFNLDSFCLFEPLISYTHEQGTVGEWVWCNSEHYVREINSTIEYHLNLTNEGYRALIYR